ncbi:MAG: DUF3418 domain-containing protein, partial [bacterium]
HKTRRRDILVDDDQIYQFYDEVVPDSVNSASGLRKWHRSLDDDGKASLLIPRERLMLNDPSKALVSYPDSLESNGISLPLNYLFDPGSEQDGVCARIPLALLNRMNAATLERVVPGLLMEKLTLLVRTLPKPLRRQFVPIPDSIAKIVDEVSNDVRPLTVSLADKLSELKEVTIGPRDFDTGALPTYLHLGFELVDEELNTIDFSRDLTLLQSEYGMRAHAKFVQQGNATIERQGITRWDFDDLPKSIVVNIGDYKTNAYPALVDCSDSVGIKVFDNESDAEQAHQEGIRRLLWICLPEQRKLLKKPLPDWQKISLMYAAIGDLPTLQLAMFRKAQDRVYFQSLDPVRTREAFEKLLREASPRLPDELVTIALSVRETLSRYRDIIRSIEKHKAELADFTLEDVRSQIEWLVYDGFVEETPAEWLVHLPRFLAAINIRLDHARIDPETDRLRWQKIMPWWNRYLECEYEYGRQFEYWRWMIEEYRVSVFAQSLKTSIRISPSRLEQAWQDAIADY